LFGFALYITPTIVALDRKHRQTAPIAAINLFFGWTVIGWVVALAWSLTTDVKTPAPPTTAYPRADPPSGG
jgi:Superinfection immunity protein